MDSLSSWLPLGLKIIFNFVAMIFPAIGEANWYEAISLIFAILMSTGFSGGLSIP